MQPLDKGSRVPLYLQLSTILANLIQSGELKPGDKLASERELAESLNISRITARIAIDYLLEKGLVYRQQGRGTFIAAPKMYSVQGFTSFSEDMRARGYRPRSHVVKQELVYVPREIQKILKVGAKDRVIHLMRVRLADDRPVALQTSYIPHKLCPGLENEDLAEQSLFAILRNRFFVHPAWTEAEMEAMPATAEEAHWLDIPPGDPVLVVRGLTFTESFEVVEYVRTVYRGHGLTVYIGRQRIVVPEH